MKQVYIIVTPDNRVVQHVAYESFNLVEGLAEAFGGEVMGLDFIEQGGKDRKQKS